MRKTTRHGPATWDRLTERKGGMRVHLREAASRFLAGGHVENPTRVTGNAAFQRSGRSRLDPAWLEMTVLTLSYIELRLDPASFASGPGSTPCHRNLTPGPAMQRHAGQMQHDRGQRGHHDHLACPSRGPSSCLSAAMTTLQPSILRPPRTCTHYFRRRRCLRPRHLTEVAIILDRSRRAIDTHPRNFFTIKVPNAFNLLRTQHGQKGVDVPRAPGAITEFSFRVRTCLAV